MLRRMLRVLRKMLLKTKVGKELGLGQGDAIGRERACHKGEGAGMLGVEIGEGKEMRNAQVGRKGVSLVKLWGSSRAVCTKHQRP